MLLKAENVKKKYSPVLLPEIFPSRHTGRYRLNPVEKTIQIDLPIKTKNYEKTVTYFIWRIII